MSTLRASCNHLNNSTSVHLFIVSIPNMSVRVSIWLCFQPCYLSSPERSNPASARGPPKVTAISRQHSIQVGTFVPAPLSLNPWLLFSFFFFHNSCQRISGEMSEGGVCVGVGGGRWVERTRGWRGHTLNPWVKMYLLKINNQAAISSCSRWFYNLVSGGREGGERSGTKTRGRRWTIVHRSRIQYSTRLACCVF